jgi:GTPase
VVTFIDVSGREKYFKTLAAGMCSTCPDYALVVIAADNGVNQTTKDHFKIAIAFNVPIIVVITKIDKCSEERVDDTRAEVNIISYSQINELLLDLNIPGMLEVRSNEDVVLYS